MVTHEEIERINELYKKSKTPEGLTPEEKEEQMHLRGKYIASVKDNLSSQLDNVVVEEKDGTKHKLHKKPNLKIVKNNEN